jgi:hypothetical protein
MNSTYACPCCNVALEWRKNPRGGGFFGCPRFETSECKISYSPTEDKWYGLPHMEAGASKLRGRCYSQRELAIRQLEALKGLSREEAVEFLDAFGLPEVQAMLAA